MGKYVVFLSTREQIEEASKAPIDQLSFNAAIDEVCLAARRGDVPMLKCDSLQQFLPHLIFNGFKFDPKDPRYSVPLNAMKVRLRDNLPALIPNLLKNTRKAFQSGLPADKARKGLICS